MKTYTLSDFTKNQDQDFDDLYEAKISLGGQVYSVQIFLDDCETADIEASLNAFLADIENFLHKAKECIVEEFWEEYNDNWRLSGKDENDNKPELDKQAFMDNLSLDAISFLGSSDIEIYFFDNDMFLGHSLVASDFDGETFHYAEMFG